jgi:asparagine synthase (glutamine-hydrolysing)
MCGIFGIVDLDEKSSFNPSTARRMGEAIFHRGPDDGGLYTAPGILIGMRRLSIIDLSGGHQPIANEDESAWVVCNGEIYNFLVLRAELLRDGHVFRTQSDTEVLLHLYESKGLDFLRYLRGMFGFALWDGKRRRLIIARDRLGEKPIYLKREAKRLLFASEVKSLLEAPGVSCELNLKALPEFLELGYVPAPVTLFKGIEKLLPGHAIVVEDGTVRDIEYWDLPLSKSPSYSEEEWVERARAKFLETVKLQMISDVPLGAFLSGGIDSSAVVSAMAQNSSRPVKTYSIGFEGDDSFYNELPYARMMASALKTEHVEIIVRPDVANLFEKLIWHLDEPIGDSAYVTTYLVSKAARESVTVILSGVGGDEIFGGYRRYLSDSLLRYYRHLPRRARSNWIPGILSRLPQDRHSNWKNAIRYAYGFARTAELDPVSRYLSYVTVFSPEVCEQLLRPGVMDEHGGPAAGSRTLQRYFAKRMGQESLDQIMYVDLKTSLADDLLALTDKMSMAASLECRAPFVDYELVELVSQIPARLKIHGLEMKYLLKKIVAPWVPRPILQRKKRGFGAPVGAWFRRDLKGLVEDTLSEGQVKKRGLFAYGPIREIIEQHRNEAADHTDHLTALVTLEMWCRIFLDGNNRQADSTKLFAGAVSN